MGRTAKFLLYLLLVLCRDEIRKLQTQLQGYETDVGKLEQTPDSSFSSLLPSCLPSHTPVASASELFQLQQKLDRCEAELQRSSHLIDFLREQTVLFDSHNLRALRAATSKFGSPISQSDELFQMVSASIPEILAKTEEISSQADERQNSVRLAKASACVHSSSIDEVPLYDGLIVATY